MRTHALALFLLAACGTQDSHQGPPSHSPASGLGPIAPLDDPTGLSWVPPFILSDAARALAHPSALTDGDAIDLWVAMALADRTTIGHAHTARFEDGLVDIAESLHAEQAWEGTSVSCPSVVAGEGERLLVYLANGKVGLARGDEGRWSRRGTPLYADGDGVPIRSIAAARNGDRLRLVVLVGERVDDLTLPLTDLGVGSPGWIVQVAAMVGAPRWGASLIELGLRVAPTATDRWREDLFFGVALPIVADLGAGPAPTAVGAASRYLDHDDARFQIVDSPILSGSPFARAASTVAYRGGVLVFYVARSGPRDAIGVGRWP